MDTLQKQYYYEMARKDRLFLFYYNNRKVCLITFYICNTGEQDRYLRSNMWSVEKDSENGNTVWIDHLWTDKDFDNPRLSYRIWHYFKEFIKRDFLQVERISWVRARMNQLSLKRERKTYDKLINRRFVKCIS